MTTVNELRFEDDGTLSPVMPFSPSPAPAPAPTQGLARVVDEPVVEDLAPVEMTLTAAEQKRADFLDYVESKRAKRWLPDTTASMILLVSIAGVVLITSGLISYATMVAVAEWMKLPPGMPWLPFAVPGFVELLIIFSSLDYIMTRSRGKVKESKTPFIAMIVLSSVAVIANAAHTIAGWGVDFSVTNWQAVIGTLLSAAAPLVVLYISKRLSALVYIDPNEYLTV